MKCRKYKVVKLSSCQIPPPQVNAAESQYWRRSEGLRVGRADELLGFDCGGQQWVLEVAFETGTLAAPSGADMRWGVGCLRSYLFVGLRGGGEGLRSCVCSVMRP